MTSYNKNNSVSLSGQNYQPYPSFSSSSTCIRKVVVKNKQSEAIIILLTSPGEKEHGTSLKKNINTIRYNQLHSKKNGKNLHLAFGIISNWYDSLWIYYDRYPRYLTVLSSTVSFRSVIHLPTFPPHLVPSPFFRTFLLETCSRLSLPLPLPTARLLSSLLILYTTHYLPSRYSMPPSFTYSKQGRIHIFTNLSKAIMRL